MGLGQRKLPEGVEVLTPDEVEERRTKSIVTAALILSLALLGGVVVLLGYKSLLEEQAKIREKQGKLPIITRLEDNLIAKERSGETVELRELKGKILVAGHVYTRCPRGCSGVAEVMRRIQEKFGEREDFHLLSFSVDPEHDSPEQLSKFTEVQGIDGDNWWFLTDQEDPEKIRKYLVNQFRFKPVQDMPEEERLNEFDLFIHDMRVALVDHKGHVRRYYSVMHATYGNDEIAALEEDIEKLYAEMAEETKGGA